MRYIDADRLNKQIEIDSKGNEGQYGDEWQFIDTINSMPTADVRKNIHAKKVIGGGECDGATCWFECSSCHGVVDIEDAYCKHCGAVLEYEPCVDI